MGTHGASTTQGCMAVKCEGGSLNPTNDKSEKASGAHMWENISLTVSDKPWAFKVSPLPLWQVGCLFDQWEAAGYPYNQFFCVS